MATSPNPALAMGDETRHPRGLYLLFTVEMWERFSFYGMKAILILYLVKSALGQNPGRGWTNAEGSILMAWYGGMAYLLPVIGGVLADKLIGTHRSMVVGGLLIALGHIVLGVTGLQGLHDTHLGMSVFIFGLALIVIGTGHFKPTVSVMVGQLYHAHDARRDSAFAIFYMGINLGAALGQIVCPLLADRVGWHWGFGAAAVGMLAGLAIYQWGRPQYLAGVGEAPDGKGRIAPLFIVVGILLAAGFAALYHFDVLNQANGHVTAFMKSSPMLGPAIAVGVAVLLFIACAWFVAIQQPGDKGPTAAIFIFMMFNALFWFAFEQAGTSLNLFAEQRTDRMLGGFEVPAGSFQAVNPVCILLLSPLFAWMWGWLGRRKMDPTQSIKIAFGLVFVGLGFLFMVWAGKLAANPAVKVSMLFLLATYFWHTVGELFLSPTGLSFVTRVAPVRFVSLLMGVWFISSFIALLVGGYAAATVEKIEHGEIKMPWHLGGQADFFMLFVVLSIGGGILILILTPLLKGLLHGRE